MRDQSCNGPPCNGRPAGLLDSQSAVLPRAEAGRRRRRARRAGCRRGPRAEGHGTAWIHDGAGHNSAYFGVGEKGPPAPTRTPRIITVSLPPTRMCALSRTRAAQGAPGRAASAAVLSPPVAGPERNTRGPCLFSRCPLPFHLHAMIAAATN
jgi:hypothetical protein